MRNDSKIIQIEQGFTLIELLIAIIIVSLLAMIAVPSFNHSISKARRADAQVELTNFAAAMERHFTVFGYYTDAAVSGNTGAPKIFSQHTPIDGGVKFYNLTIVSASASAFTIRATPINGQYGDGYLEYTSTGVQRWDRNDDGDTNDANEDHW